jgi:zinc/manganese transport system substrate-binding protein
LNYHSGVGVLCERRASAPSLGRLVPVPLKLFLVGLLLGPGAAEAAQLNVTATVPDLAAIAQEVGGKRADVTSLTLPTQDPHYVDARPHLVLRLNRADLLLAVGLQLEVGWLPTLQTGARNPRIQKGADGYLDCSTLVELKEIPRTRVDRSMGDVHPGGNPHYLVDPDNAIRVARGIARRMAKLDPDGTKIYWTNAKELIKELERAKSRWRALMEPHQRAPVATYHKSWIYFTEAVGVKTVAHLEPKPGIPPNAAHVLRVIKLMRTEGVAVILQEEYYPDRTATLVAAKTGAQLLLLPGGAHFREGQSYIERMDLMVKKLASALKKAQR